jgi:hypothetical protein
MENAATALATIDALHELTDELRELGQGPVPIARAVTEVLHRSGLGHIDLVEYLESKGHAPQMVVHLVVGFSMAVRDAYTVQYGHAPLKRLVDHGAGPRAVNSYIELDRPLIDRVYAGWVQ